ncbi:MAG: UvrD-helicase domain-containing protein [Clostridium sp.]|nr:MAG: UvrD-helicase domain-containing protein [Clostridium sp.]
MVGDANQSIYQFRGARPELFRSLTNLGYNEYKINVSIRCHPSIIYYANKIYDLHLAKNYKDESHVNLISKINSNFLNGLTGSSFYIN